MPSDAYTFRNWISIAAKTYSNVTIYPMVCLASVYELSSDWQSPAKTNQQLTQDTTALLDNTEVNGAVNMLPTASSSVSNGITYTVDDDGIVTANGTATGESSISISTKLKKRYLSFFGCSKDRFLFKLLVILSKRWCYPRK